MCGKIVLCNAVLLLLFVQIQPDAWAGGTFEDSNPSLPMKSLDQEMVEINLPFHRGLALKEIVSAIQRRDPNQLNLLLKKTNYRYVNSTYGHQNFSLLMWAAQSGDIHGFDLLLKAGADPFPFEGRVYKTVFDLAQGDYQRRQFARLIIRNFSTFDEGYNFNLSFFLFKLVEEIRDPLLVKMFLEKFKSRYVNDRHGEKKETPLMVAAEHSDRYIIALLLSAGANPFLERIGGKSLPSVANSNTPIPYFIAGATIKYFNRMEDVSAHERLIFFIRLVRLLRQPKLVKDYLLKFGNSGINEYDRIMGQTPLMIAAENGDLKIVILLLKNGANPFLKSRLLGWNTMYYSFESETSVQVAEAIAKYSTEMSPEVGVLESLSLF